jgi:hypothetical protein
MLKDQNNKNFKSFMLIEKKPKLSNNIINTKYNLVQCEYKVICNIVQY